MEELARLRDAYEAEKYYGGPPVYRGRAPRCHYCGRKAVKMWEGAFHIYKKLRVWMYLDDYIFEEVDPSPILD